MITHVTKCQVMQALLQEQRKDTGSALFREYRAVRKRSEQLCSPLKTEDYVVQPVGYVSPPKWHLAHTTWFFEMFILKDCLDQYKTFNPEYGYLFNSYYEYFGKRVLQVNRGNMTRPAVDEIYTYRKYVDQFMEELLTLEKLPEPYKDVLVLGLNHEQQHQELLLTDIKYILGHNPLFPSYSHTDHQNAYPRTIAEWINVAGGIYEAGFSGAGFCYDNERKRHKVYLQEYAISNRLVTNEEYLQFIEAGCYTNYRYWHSDGWAWVKEEKITAPLYWHKIDGQWFIYTLNGLIPLPLQAPVCHISYYEAAAYAAWRNRRLPTEFEWETAQHRFHWGQRWEWTESAYLPYPGFKKAPGPAGEYNGKFMVNQKVLRGASVATPRGHSRPTYRNFFQPHLRWQFTGLRLAQ